tara:strand:+ start:715 stop:1083 length:369 start_codon:yes stop_codon:yes gene_type:complete
MSKKKTKLNIDGLKDLESKINNLTSELEDKIKPILNFDKLQSTIDDLSKAFNSKNNSSEDKNEGETCMHGNSWNSECSDCNELNLVDSVFKLVKEYPNDSELGAKVREFYNSYTTNSDNIEE